MAHSLKTQLTFSGKVSCSKFLVNAGRLNAAKAEVVCIDCFSPFTDHTPEAVTDEDVAMFLSHQEASLGANCILDEDGMGKVFVGGKQASIEPFVSENQIGAVVNTSDLHTFPRRDYQQWAKKVEELERTSSLSILRLGWSDELANQKLWKEKPWDQLEQAILFVENARIAGKNVVIHCAQGKSRSGTVMVAYLMAKKNLNFDDALKLARSKRTILQPNPSFEKQLRDFQRSPALAQLREQMA